MNCPLAEPYLLWRGKQHQEGDCWSREIVHPLHCCSIELEDKEAGIK
jgi:hypothetical protein